MEAIVINPKTTRYDALLYYARAASKHYQGKEYEENEKTIERLETLAVAELTRRAK